MWRKTRYYTKYSAYSISFSPLHFVLYLEKIDYLWDSVLTIMHCPNNNLKPRIATDSAKNGADATAYVWHKIRLFRLLLGQCMVLYISGTVWLGNLAVQRRKIHHLKYPTIFPIFDLGETGQNSFKFSPRRLQNPKATGSLQLHRKSIDH